MRHAIPAVVVLLCTAVSTADVVTVGADLDNTLYESTIGDISNGMGSRLFIGRTNMNLRRRTVLSFDVAGALPDGAIVTDVTLTLHVSQGMGIETDSSIHRLSSAWGEGASDADGSEGQGAPAEPGDATWIHTFYDTDTWANPGGDYAGIASATTLVPNSGFTNWNDSAMIADVMGWVDDPASNFGWIILGDEVNLGNAKRFDSRQAADEMVRPSLVITFDTIPAPGALAVFGLAAMGRRRRRVTSS